MQGSWSDNTQLWTLWYMIYKVLYTRQRCENSIHARKTSCLHYEPLSAWFSRTDSTLEQAQHNGYTNVNCEAQIYRDENTCEYISLYVMKFNYESTVKGVPIIAQKELNLAWRQHRVLSGKFKSGKINDAHTCTTSYILGTPLIMVINAICGSEIMPIPFSHSVRKWFVFNSLWWLWTRFWKCKGGVCPH